MIYLLPDAVRASASARPAHPAFRCGGAQLTYAELQDRVEQLAAVLHGRGVGPGDRVGVLLHRCLETPVAIYAIMRLGAVFVPLNPRAPAARTAFQLQDCGCSVIVTHPLQRRVVAELPERLASAPSVVDVTAPGTAPAAPPPAAITEDDPAYLIYTSGSTGDPKAIVHSHRSGLAFARLMVDTFGLTRDDVFGNHAPVFFDVSQLALFGAPLLGATAVLATDAEVLFPASLSKLIGQEAVTVWYSVPLALIQLLDQPREWGALRWVFYAGEPFPPRQLAALMRSLPRARVANLYGPAETNVCTAYVLPGPPEGDEPVPIGTAWARTDVLIEDGELCIRSPTLMRGYWRRPELNARAFLLRPGVDGLPDRYYRSGDLVERRANGLLYFRGRRDSQVKVRGYRVELGAVETALLAHSGVREAVVLATDGERRQLAAAVLPAAGGAAPSERELRVHLGQRLPDYAVPATIHPLEEFPRTGTGKVDRPALLRQLESTWNRPSSIL